MSLSAYDDPRNLRAYEQMQRQEMERRYERQQMAAIQNLYAQAGGIGAAIMQPAPKQEEPNKALLLLSPVA